MAIHRHILTKECFEKLNPNFDLPAVILAWFSSPSLSATSVSLPDKRDIRRRCALYYCLSPIPLTPFLLSTASKEKAAEKRSQNINARPFSLRQNNQSKYYPNRNMTKCNIRIAGAEKTRHKLPQNKHCGATAIPRPTNHILIYHQKTHFHPSHLSFFPSLCVSDMALEKAIQSAVCSRLKN